VNANETSPVPEDHDAHGLPVARLDAHEWEIHCASEACDAFIADASWLDIQVAMILNGSDEFSSREALARLPAQFSRPFRMNAHFPPDWHKREEDEAWERGRGFERRSGKPGEKTDTYNRRLIKGQVRAIALSQEATPPARACCPDCGLLQMIERRRRKGPPGPAIGTLSEKVDNFRYVRRDGFNAAGSR